VQSINDDKLQQIQDYARTIAALMYEEPTLEQLTTLEGIKAAVRGHILEDMSPESVFPGRGNFHRFGND
jgi:hypothetical protein